jgi:hypothetical protein
MLNLNICANCQKGDYNPSRMTRDGEMTRAPSVECNLAGGAHLTSESQIPNGCPYILEQKLTEDEAWSNMDAVQEEFYKEAVV